MQKITFTNARGDFVEIGEFLPFYLTAIDGFGDLEADTQTQKAPYQDGVTYVDSVLPGRDIVLLVTISDDNVYRQRRKLSSVFNPKLGPGTLKYEYDGGVKIITAVPDGVPSFPSNNTSSGSRTATTQLTTINLFCPDPYWTDEAVTSEPMNAYKGLFSFPLSLPTQMGTQSSTAIFVNEGDVPTPVEITMTGPVTNPKISNNTTGEFIKVNQSLADGQTLTINTAFGNKRVEITDEEGNATNVFNWIDPESAFWNLEVGENEVEYTADSGGDSAGVTLTYYNKYVGI